MIPLKFKFAAVAIFILGFIALVSGRLGGGQVSESRKLDTRATITYFIMDGAGEPGYRASDRELAKWALEAWQRSIGKGFRLEASAEANSVVRVYWGEATEGLFGEMVPLTVGGRVGAAVYIRPDVASLGPGLARGARADDLLRDSIVYLTCLHELGHALGLEHTQDFSDIMYFFGYGGDIPRYFGRYRDRLRTRSDIAMVSGLSNADMSHIRQLYGEK